MLGPGTYEDPSCGFKSVSLVVQSGAVLGSSIANLIGMVWVLMVNLDISVNK